MPCAYGESVLRTLRYLGIVMGVTGGLHSSLQHMTHEELLFLYDSNMNIAELLGLYEGGSAHHDILNILAHKEGNPFMGHPARTS